MGGGRAADPGLLRATTRGRHVCSARTWSPLDGSELSEHALPYAEMLAWAGDARLVLTHAVLPPAAPRYLLQDLEGAVGELEHAARAAATTLTPTTAHG